MGINLLGWVNEFFYTGLNTSWGFEGIDPRLDQLADNMDALGLTPAYVHKSLRRRGVNERFEKLVETYDHLVDRVVTDAISMSHYPHSRIFSPDEKREYVVEGIIDGLRQQNSSGTAR